MGLQTLEHFLITQPVTIFFDFLIVHHHNEEQSSETRFQHDFFPNNNNELQKNRQSFQSRKFKFLHYRHPRWRRYKQRHLQQICTNPSSRRFFKFRVLKNQKK